MYKHVVSRKVGSFSARALVGSHSVMLAWNHTGPVAERQGLLGFAVHRFDLTSRKDVWLQGQKRFANQEDFGPNIRSDLAPFQRFRWGDYGVYPGRRYRYEIHPVTGSPPGTLGAPLRLSVEPARPMADRVGVFSNRGVSASLAYRLKFELPPQNLDEPRRAEAYEWLTRELKPALLAFIGAAKSGDELRVAIYEFEDHDIRQALIDARGRNVTVRLVYHARAGTKQAEQNAIEVGPLEASGAEVVARTNTEKLSHNKFIVHLVAGQAGAPPTPARVWTGSTNLTRAGFYLQTNLGLVLEAPEIANGFARYWDILRRNEDRDATRAADETLVTDIRATLPAGPKVFLSPVRGRELLDTAIDLVRNATDLVLISSPFGLDIRIRDAINANGQNVVEYGLVNSSSRVLVKQLPHANSRFSWFTTPAWLPEWDGRLWDNQPFGNHRIHTKSIVTDPFSNNPRILIGSTNFSDESVNGNDENAFLIEGERRAAAIVATEFLRMFDHYKTRAYIASLEEKPDAQYLAQDGSWTLPYFQPFRLKFRERVVFGGH